MSEIPQNPADREAPLPSEIAAIPTEEHGEISLGDVHEAKPTVPLSPEVVATESESPRQRRTRESFFTYTTNALLTLITILAVFLGFQRFLPMMVREVSYSYHHGKQKAEYDLATKLLDEHPMSEFTTTFEAVTKKAGPAVVHINVQSKSNDGKEPRLPSRFRFPSGQGSGVIVDNDGYIVTNEHVVRDAQSIEVRLTDCRVVKAQLIGSDIESDLALIKVEAPNLIAAHWGDSDSQDEGSPVWAMGSPFGLDRSVTFGILSAKHRAGMAGTAYQDYLQTDAAVNPGNSGGPLLNARGEVIGINTAIVGESYQGVSFSIPSNVARSVCERLKSEGIVTRGWLGVQLAEVDEELAREHGLTEVQGAKVTNLMDIQDMASPAKAAGIQAGDIVLEWNGAAIKDSTALIRKVGETKVGEKAEITVRRGQSDLKLTIAVGKRPTGLRS